MPMIFTLTVKIQFDKRSMYYNAPLMLKPKDCFVRSPKVQGSFHCALLKSPLGGSKEEYATK